MSASETEQENLQARTAELQEWFHGILPSLGENGDGGNLQPVTGDASFRRYFISQTDSSTYILVDSPPAREDNRTFVQIAEKFMAAGITVPVVYDVNYEKGFMCLSYLGDTLLWEKLNTLASDNYLAEANVAYQHAFQVLLKIQKIRPGQDILLPNFDGVIMLGEMELFREWFCSGIMGLELNDKDNALLEHFFEMFIDAAMSQPQVCVHRDYHSRNLLYKESGDYGVLDFQDAVVGPITYDLVSLIKDCYISWPRALVREWALQYANLAQTEGIIESFRDEEFLFSLDMMGVQRHLKAIGIFSRLYLRDGKSAYLADIPRTLAYIKEVLGEYPGLYAMGSWFEKNIYPMLVTRLNAVINRGRL